MIVLGGILIAPWVTVAASSGAATTIKSHVHRNRFMCSASVLRGDFNTFRIETDTLPAAREQ